MACRSPANVELLNLNHKNTREKEKEINSEQVPDGFRKKQQHTAKGKITGLVTIK